MANRQQHIDLSNELPTDRAAVLIDTQHTKVHLRWLGMRMDIDGKGPAGSPIHMATAMIYLTLAGVLPGGLITMISAFTPIQGPLAIGIATALFIVVFSTGYALLLRPLRHPRTPSPPHTPNGHGKRRRAKSRTGKRR